MDFGKCFLSLLACCLCSRLQKNSVGWHPTCDTTSAKKYQRVVVMNGYSDKIQMLLQEKDRMLIGGGWVRSRSGGGFSINDPGREEKICEVPLAAGEDVELAVEAASGSSATWRKLDPLFFAACKIAAFLVAGNTVILKPAEQTSLSALEMGKYVQEIFPPGVVN